MSYVQKLLDNISSLKGEGTELEIELKFILDPRSKVPKFVSNNTSKSKSASFMKEVIEKFINSGSRFSIEETMNFIQRDKTNIIKQLVFKEGVQQKDKKNFYTKKPLTNPVYLLSNGRIPIKFSISEEKKIAERKVNTELIRSKLRLSIYPSNKFASLKNWRIDITLVKSLDKVNSLAEIKSVRNKLFPPGLTFENFASKAPWDYADSMELEIESLDPGSVTEANIKELDQELGGSMEESSESTSGEMQVKLFEIAKLIAPKIANSFRPPSKKGLRALANNVVELNRHMFFADLKPEVDQYLITDKADGFRVFLHLIPQRGECWVITSKTSEMVRIPKSNTKECVADAEMIGNSFLVFDVMIYNGRRVYKIDFEQRQPLLEDIAKLAPNIHAKKFVACPPDTCDIAKIVQDFKEAKKPVPYEQDGIIFTSLKGNYRKTTNYKWKPSKDTTIDFLVRECPKFLLGIEPHVNKPGKVLYLLFNGIDSEMLRRINLDPIHRYKELFPSINLKKDYSPIQFSPSSKPYAYLFWHERKDLNQKIVELHYTPSTDKWRLHKIRDDKTLDAENGVAFGNDYRIAELVWQNYFNPITMTDLKMSKEEGLKNVYFKQYDTSIYKAMRNYNSYVKEKLFTPYEKSGWSIDLGAGKGQDLFRYIRAGINNVLFVDIDSMALNELINRKYSFANPRSQQSRHSNEYINQSININILEADLNDDFKVNLEKIKAKGIPIPGEGVPVIVCNFAIHYFVGTDAMRKNFISLIDSLLAPKGRFIFTTFDGEKIFQLLEETGSWDQKEEGKLKYSLKKDYHSSDFTGNNQKIKVLQPFSEDTYYTEYLVNHTLLEKEFKKFGMQQEIFESFDIYQEDFKKHNPGVYDKLSDLDKTYSSLYTINSYYKK
jgi:hypothetical protein